MSRETPTQLLKSSQRLSLLLEHTPLAVIEWTPTFKIADWNPTAQNIFGYSKSEVVGTDGLELLWLQSAREQLNQLWQQLWQQPIPISHTSENLTKTGKIIYCQWHNIPLIDGAGKIVSVASWVDDVTEQKLAEDALQNTKEQLEICLEARTHELTIALVDLKEASAQLKSEIAERQQLETCLLQQQQQYGSVVNNVEARLRKQLTALSELAQCQAIYNGDLAIALPEITKTVSRTLEVERCSVWLYNDDHSLIRCLNLDKLPHLEPKLNSIVVDGEARAEKVSSGKGNLYQHLTHYQLTATQNPDYFKALEEERIIAVTDVYIDPRTREFSTSYLRPLNITSVLDIPIRLGGIVVGVMCIEHTGAPHEWTLEEQSFASTTANLVSLAMEASNRAATEKALRQSQEQFHQLTENIREVFFLSNPDLSQFYYISPAYAEIWGRTVQSLHDQPSSWFDSVHPDDCDRVFQAFTKHLQGEQVFNQEYRIILPDGLERWVWVRAFPVLNDSGVVERTAGLAEDITERKRAEAEILNTLAQEKELGDLKSRFISITSHEFRTPLTTILSTTELLEYYEWSKHEQIEHLHVIQNAVSQMLQLLEDKLFIGTAEAGKLPFHPVLLDVPKLCQDLVTEIQWGLSWKISPPPLQHTINFVSHVHSFIAPMDRKLLRHILTNLLSNAIKYSPGGGTVRFELICQAEQVVFRIQDWGIGILPEDQPRLFQFFHRGSNVGAINGTGLGLAIVKKCVELHGGQISFRSQVGAGTTFTVTLPLFSH